MKADKAKVGNWMSVRRLPAYLHLLRILDANGREFVSTTHMADELKLQPDQIRKDLSMTGIIGKPKIGYHVPTLVKAIEGFLRWDNTTDAVLVGAGNLGSALLGYKGFSAHGLNIVAAFDADVAKVGRMVHGYQILPMDKLPDLIRRMHVHMGIITVPAEYAQEAADALVTSGVVAIWNFAPASVEVCEDIVVQNEDLSSGLAILSVKLAKMMGAE